MTTPLFISLVFALVLAVYGAIALRTWLRLRGNRVVTCPETDKPVTVTVDLPHAVTSAIWERADIRLTSCTRWPERQDCDQPCCSQIEAQPDATAPNNMTARFFTGKRCAMCQRPIDPPAAMTLQPGFMDPITRRVRPWDEIRPEALPEAFDTWRPLCMNCTLAESFRQKFPGRVTDRQHHA
jgi:hypothetical protein